MIWTGDSIIEVAVVEQTRLTRLQHQTATLLAALKDLTVVADTAFPSDRLQLALVAADAAIRQAEETGDPAVDEILALRAEQAQQFVEHLDIVMQLRADLAELREALKHAKAEGR